MLAMCTSMRERAAAVHQVGGARTAYRDLAKKHPWASPEQLEINGGTETKWGPWNNALPNTWNNSF